MNETILNGVINILAILTHRLSADKATARQTVLFYLFNHFGVHSRDEYIALYDQLIDLYGEMGDTMASDEVIKEVCRRMKEQLSGEDQLMFLLLFMEFSRHINKEWKTSRGLFEHLARLFSIDDELFDDSLTFMNGELSPKILLIREEPSSHPLFIERKGLMGEIHVFQISRYDLMIFTYFGESPIYFNDSQVIPRMFYAWERSGVLKSSRFSPVYFSNLRTVFNHQTQSAEIRLCGRDLQFNFKESPNGLHNFSFSLRSGELVAIMGGSGVGKSTLLSILNGTLQPNSGTITVNGRPLNADEVKDRIGFVPQDDLLIEELTVYQNLYYTARFCFAHLTPQALQEKVDGLLKELDLYAIRSLEVGSPIKKTISGGQRKRLNIALELIRQPAILYLDEPTSGLSSTDSEKVMLLLKEQTHKGCLVLVNIHQPSSEIFKLFDRLWLLDKGGYPIYDGNPIEAITYFKRMSNYTDQDVSICHTCGNINPELVLNIIDEKKIDHAGKQGTQRKFTPGEWHDNYLRNRGTFAPPQTLPLPSTGQSRPSVWKQFCIFLERNLLSKWSNKQYLLIALLEAPLLALIVALMTHFAPDEGYTLINNKNLVSYIFMSVIVITFIGMSMSAEEIIKDRALLKREQFLRLSRAGYLCSKFVFLAGVSALQSLLFIVVGNGIIGLGGGLFLSWWLALWATAFLANLIGLLLSQSLNSVVSIYITIPVLLIPQILLCGLVVKFDDLNRWANNRNETPIISELIPARWVFEALVVDTYANNDFDRDFFYIDKEQWLAQYYRSIHLKDVLSMVNGTGLISDPVEKASKQRTIENELRVLARAARIEPRLKNESAESFLARADTALKTRSDNFTALRELRQNEMIAAEGVESFNKRKMNNHNTALEDLVMNAHPAHFNREANHRLWPKIGQIYLEPENPLGRAPFYAYAKKAGNIVVDTYTFNLLVIAFFAVLVIISIFAEFPVRIFRRK